MLDYQAEYDTAGLFSRELRQRIIQRFTRSNAAIGKKYLPGQSDTLFPDLADETYEAPSKEMDPQRIAKLLLGLQANQEKSNIRFLRRLSKLERQVEKQTALLSALGKDDNNGDA